MRTLLAVVALAFAVGARADSGTATSDAGMCGDHDHSGVMSRANVKVENTKNGAVVRIDAKDKADVPKIQEHVRMMRDCMQSHASAAGAGHMHHRHDGAQPSGSTDTHHEMNGTTSPSSSADVGTPGATRSSADPRATTAGSSTNGADTDSQRTGAAGTSTPGNIGTSRGDTTTAPPTSGSATSNSSSSTGR